MGKNYNSSRLVNGLFVDSSGNVAVNDTTASGYRFKVNGTMGVTGATTFSSSVTANGLTTVNNAASSPSLLIYGGNSTDPRTDSASGELRIGNNASYYGRVAYSNGGSTALYIDNSYDNAAASIVFRMRTLGSQVNALTILGSGNVLIGKTTSTGGVLQVSNGTNMFNVDYDANGPYITAVNNANTVYKRLTYDASEHVFDISATERMRITSGGDVYIGNSTISTANTAIFLQKSGIITTVRAYSSGTIPLVEFYKQSAGDIGSISYNGTNTLYNSTSDYRLKEDLKDYNAIEIIGKLKTYDFKWKDTDVRDYGMMAHELQEILPNYVTGEKDAIKEDGAIKPQGVDYSKIVPILVKAIQEQQAEIDELKNK